MKNTKTTKQTQFAVTERETDVKDVVIASEDRHKAGGRRDPTEAISSTVDKKMYLESIGKCDTQDFREQAPGLH